MRTCENCAFRQENKKGKTYDLCLLQGNLCRVLVADPSRQGCSEHQFSEATLMPLLNASFALVLAVKGPEGSEILQSEKWRQVAEEFIARFMKNDDFDAHSHLGNSKGKS